MFSSGSGKGVGGRGVLKGPCSPATVKIGYEKYGHRRLSFKCLADPTKFLDLQLILLLKQYRRQ